MLFHVISMSSPYRLHMRSWVMTAHLAMGESHENSHVAWSSIMPLG